MNGIVSNPHAKESRIPTEKEMSSTKAKEKAYLGVLPVCDLVTLSVMVERQVKDWSSKVPQRAQFHVLNLRTQMVLMLEVINARQNQGAMSRDANWSMSTKVH